MRYPSRCQTIVDVTKPPYCADNTGKTDCTDALRRALDDILVRHVEATEAFYRKMMAVSDNCQRDVYVGFECGRVRGGKLQITSPEFEPFTRVLYFPNGTYLVSDTVTYTLKNLKNKYYSNPDYDLSRNIHFLGEDREGTVIRLCDNAEGFDVGGYKPLLSFNTTETERSREVSNVCQMCMLEDLTLDMGRGNGGVGVRYHSSNNGRIENVTIRSECGTAGIFTVRGSEATFSDLTVEGFDYGMDIAYSSLLTLDGIDLSKNRVAGILTCDSAMTLRHITSGNLQTLSFGAGSCGRYYLADGTATYGDPKGNFVCRDPFETEIDYLFPKNPHREFGEDYAFVDDFGAIGDGVTDCTEALRRAFASGKPTVLFGDGQYLINGTVKIPATVNYVDFNFCQLASGTRLIGGEVDSAFEIAETSSETLFVENLYTTEQFYGHMRLLKQSCVREVVLSDLQTTMACLYFNTVGGSRVWLDNIFLTTGTYCDNRALKREGLLPIYSRNVPIELHGQTLIGRGVNLERAEVAMLCDASEVWLDGFRTEGPGTALKVMNGGRATVRVFDAGIGDREGSRPLFDADESYMDLWGIRALGYNAATEYNILVRRSLQGRSYEFTSDDARLRPALYPFTVLVEHYCSERPLDFA